MRLPLVLQKNATLTELKIPGIIKNEKDSLGPCRVLNISSFFKHPPKELGQGPIEI